MFDFEVNFVVIQIEESVSNQPYNGKQDIMIAVRSIKKIKIYDGYTNYNWVGNKLIWYNTKDYGY